MKLLDEEIIMFNGLPPSEFTNFVEQVLLNDDNIRGMKIDRNDLIEYVRSVPVKVRHFTAHGQPDRYRLTMHIGDKEYRMETQLLNFDSNNLESYTLISEDRYHMCVHRSIQYFKNLKNVYIRRQRTMRNRMNSLSDMSYSQAQALRASANSHYGKGIPSLIMENQAVPPLGIATTSTDPVFADRRMNDYIDSGVYGGLMDQVEEKPESKELQIKNLNLNKVEL